MLILAPLSKSSLCGRSCCISEECFHTIVRKGSRRRGGDGEAVVVGGGKAPKSAAEQKNRRKRSRTRREKLLGLPNSRRPFKESVFLKDQK